MIMGQQAQCSKVRSIARAWIYAPVMATSFLAFAQPTHATIDNTATASGLYGLVPVTSAGDTVNIPVVLANPSLSVVKSVSVPATTEAVGSEPGVTDGLDTITYQYLVTNTGNVTITGVTPVDAGPSFGNPQTPGDNALGAFSPAPVTLIPGQAQIFTAVYTLSDEDAFRAAGLTVPADAVNNSATATGTPASGTLAAVTPSNVSTLIAAGARLTVNKSFVLDDTNGIVAGQAELNETITYTYTVFNNGNVPISNVVINDTHELVLITPATLFAEALTTEGPLGTPASTDASGVNGSWDLIQPGATVTFTYVHAVTQAEVDGG